MLRVDDVYGEPAYYNALHYTMLVSMIVKQPGMVLSFSTEGSNLKLFYVFASFDSSHSSYRRGGGR